MKMDGKQQCDLSAEELVVFYAFQLRPPDVRGADAGSVNLASPHSFTSSNGSPMTQAIGGLDRGWNFLEGEYPKPKKAPPVIHFTNGGPWFDALEGLRLCRLWLQRTRPLPTVRGGISRFGRLRNPASIPLDADKLRPSLA